MADPYGNLLPEEYQQQQAINRQQQLANMLMQNNQQPQGQMISGRYVAPSFFQNIAPLVNTYVGKGLLEQGDVKAAKLAEAIRGRNATELQDIVGTLQGTSNYKPAVMPQIQRDDMGNVMPAIENQIGQAPDKQAALMKALKSTSPIGQMVANSLITKSLEGPKFHNVASGASLLQETPEGIKSVFTNPKEHELSTEIKTALALNPSLPRNPDNWTEKDAQVAALTIAQHKKLTAPQSTTYVDARVANSLAAPIGTILQKSQEATIGAYNNLTSANAILSNVDKAITGPAANERLGVAQLANTLGLGNPKNPEALAATRVLIQNMAKLQIGTHVKGEGAVSDFERRLKAAAEGGDVKFTPVEIKQMANTTKNSANYQIQQHNEAIKSAQGLGTDSAAIANMYKINPPSQPTVQYLGPVKP
jgi:hypothetical protein